MEKGYHRQPYPVYIINLIPLRNINKEINYQIKTAHTTPKHQHSIIPGIYVTISY